MPFHGWRVEQHLPLSPPETCRVTLGLRAAGKGPESHRSGSRVTLFRFRMQVSAQLRDDPPWECVLQRRWQGCPPLWGRASTCTFIPVGCPGLPGSEQTHVSLPSPTLVYDQLFPGPGHRFPPGAGGRLLSFLASTPASEEF